MCEKVIELQKKLKSIKSRKETLTKTEYFDEIKAFKRQWIEVAINMDSCSEELNKLGNEMTLSISLN